MAKVKWQDAPQEHDYPAAAQYLSLLVGDPALRAELAGQLHDAPVAHYKAKDLLRASQLPLLPEANPHVAADLRKIRKRQPLSAVLLVRGDLIRGFPLQVADGYHRVCASYYIDENTDIPCRLIDLPTVVAQLGQDRLARSQAGARRRIGRCLLANAGRSKNPASKEGAGKEDARKEGGEEGDREEDREGSGPHHSS